MWCDRCLQISKCRLTFTSRPCLWSCWSQTLQSQISHIKVKDTTTTGERKEYEQAMESVNDRNWHSEKYENILAVFKKKLILFLKIQKCWWFWNDRCWPWTGRWTTLLICRKWSGRQLIICYIFTLDHEDKINRFSSWLSRSFLKSCSPIISTRMRTNQNIAKRKCLLPDHVDDNINRHENIVSFLAAFCLIKT